MDECISNHQFFLSENYIVQPVENVSCTIIDYDKIDMAQLIQSGQLTLGTPVIQLAEVHSNIKSRELHPLELEVQKDYELKQQQQEVIIKSQQPSGIHSPSHSDLNQYENKPQVSSSYNLFSEELHFQAEHEKKNDIEKDEVFKNFQEATLHFFSSNEQMTSEKRQLILLSNKYLFMNSDVKEDQNSKKNIINGNHSNSKMSSYICKSDFYFQKEKKIKNAKEAIGESDSESDEDDVQPVCDFEPDPDNNTKSKNEQNEKPNKCYMCFKSFRQKKNMYAHIRKIHSTQPKIEGGILCPLCKMHSLRQEHLRTHLETLHGIQIEKEERLFNTMEEFFKWKELMEKETLSFYVSKSSSKLLANNQQKTYYKCHRSGNYETLKSESRKKKLKAQGSNKIGATCPAAIEVTENVQGINVIFWKTHVGHNNDLSRLFLSKEEKAKIMDYVASGFSWNQILDMCKEEAKSSGLTSKLTVVSKQDLRNIKKNHQTKPSQEFFNRKKLTQGRKATKESLMRSASKSLLLEKAEALINLLESTDIRPEFRPKICLMIDNLISTIKRRSLGRNCKKENSNHEKKDWIRRNYRKIVCEKERQS